MSKDTAKFEFVILMIQNLESYQNRYGGVFQMLQDGMAFDAVLMCLMQIGETLNKIKGQYKELDDDEIKGAYDVRNFIAHDYEGVRKSIIEDVVRYYIPKLKSNIEKILEKEEE